MIRNDVIKFFEQYSEIEKRAVKCFEQIEKFERSKGSKYREYYDYSYFTIWDNYIDLYGNYSWSGDSEIIEYTLSMDEFCNFEKYMEDKILKYEAEQKKKADLEQQRLEKKEKTEAQKEYELFLKLQEKFNGSN